ncbi:MAG: hypothetical protein OHK0017_05420 [Patescibacteria group bacterium]
MPALESMTAEKNTKVSQKTNTEPSNEKTESKKDEAKEYKVEYKSAFEWQKKFRKQIFQLLMPTLVGIDLGYIKKGENHQDKSEALADLLRPLLPPLLEEVNVGEDTSADEDKFKEWLDLDHGGNKFLYRNLATWINQPGKEYHEITIAERIEALLLSWTEVIETSTNQLWGIISGTIHTFADGQYDSIQDLFEQKIEQNPALQKPLFDLNKQIIKDLVQAIKENNYNIPEKLIVSIRELEFDEIETQSLVTNLSEIFATCHDDFTSATSSVEVFPNLNAEQSQSVFTEKVQEIVKQAYIDQFHERLKLKHDSAIFQALVESVGSDSK